MLNKKRIKEESFGRIKGFSIQFLPYSEIEDVDSNERIKKILRIILGNNILILQGRLTPDEEARLIGDTMVMIDHLKNFKGIELAVISGSDGDGFFKKIKKSVAYMLVGGDLSSITIIGPATVIKEIKKKPKKI